MATSIEPADIHFNAAGMPISNSFDDIYFSNQDGAAETRYVFMLGNRLPERFQCWPASCPFVIAETGFGSGLNMLIAAAEFIQHAPAHARLQLVSFERYPLHKDDIARALQHWPQLKSLCNALLADYPPLVNGVYRVTLHPRVTLDLHLGDVLEMLPAWVAVNPAKVHAWFLDGFAPSKNPDMWQPSLYRAMAAGAAHTCTLATFTAVGAVRRGLIDAGFAMYKMPGYGRKRDMLRGTRVSPQAAPAVISSPTKRRRIAVIGGGIGAASVLRLLSQRVDAKTLDLHLFCRDHKVAQGASGNPQGAVYPLLQADYTPTTQYYTQAFVFARNFYQRWAAAHCHWSGLLQLGFTPAVTKRQQQTLLRTAYPQQLVRAVDAAEASSISGIECVTGGLFFPSAGWVSPQALVQQLLAASSITQHLATSVGRIERCGQSWRIRAQQANPKDTEDFLFDDVILANGADLQQFNHHSFVIRPVGGQITQVRSTPQAAALKTVLCHKGYITPAQQHSHCLGATFTKLDPTDEQAYIDNKLRVADDNLENLQLSQRHSTLKLTADDVSGARRAVRATTPNHLPIVGTHPYYALQAQGVWVLGGFGSRGLTSAPWCAQWLIDQMFAEVQAVNQRVSKALHSERFAAKP